MGGLVLLLVLVSPLFKLLISFHGSLIGTGLRTRRGLATGLGPSNGLGVWGVQTGLNKALSFRDRHEGLKFWGREGVHMTSLRGNQKKGLGTSQGCEFIGLE